MRTVNSRALRPSVCSAVAVAVISLMAWSFESYSAYLFQRSNGTAPTIYASTTTDATSLDG